MSKRFPPCAARVGHIFTMNIGTRIVSCMFIQQHDGSINYINTETGKVGCAVNWQTIEEAWFKLNMRGTPLSLIGFDHES